MIIAAHQPHYLPWLGYLDKLARADVFVVMDDLPYEPHDFQARQRLRLPDGPGWLTVPLVAGTPDDRICDKRIDNTDPPAPHWQTKHWMAIEINYQRARYFARYADELREVYARTWDSLVELDLHLLGLACNWLAIRTPIVRASSLGLRGHKTARLLDLCRKLGARAYLSGRGRSGCHPGDDHGDDLDDVALGRAGVDVIWQAFDHPVYQQRYPERGFDARLGFLDLVLNCGPASAEVLFHRRQPARVTAA